MAWKTNGLTAWVRNLLVFVLLLTSSSSVVAQKRPVVPGGINPSNVGGSRPRASEGS